MKAIRKSFTHKLQIIKVAANGVQNTKFCAALLFLILLIGIFSLSSAFSSLMNSIVIRSTGEILTSAYARSGSARDIQAAVDWVLANGGMGKVYIPQGTFNFVEPGEHWVTVNIPAEVSLFGAPTERDANGQVVEWKTVLVMPYEAPFDSTFFKVTDEQNRSKPFRFSDIKLVGYREFDPNSTVLYNGLIISDVLDFRVDHCYFRNIAGIGVASYIGDYGHGGRKEYGRTYTCGVIDHCKFINTHGHVEASWANSTVHYGVNIARGSYCEEWEEDISKVLGQYTPYTVFIEDCYFEKWRHCVVGNRGAHYVFRHNTIADDYGYGSLDAHGWGWIEEGRVLVGTRAMEIYNNQFLNPIQWKDCIWVRGGAGVFFNNTVSGYTHFVYLSQEASDDVPKCQIHDVWVWNNNLPEGCTEITVYYGEKNPILEGTHYFRHAPHTFNYQPYPYPHPLTLEAAP